MRNLPSYTRTIRIPPTPGRTIVFRGFPILLIQLIGGLGLSIDFVFHWLKKENFLDFLRDYFWEVENPLWEDFPLGGVWFIRIFSLTAHIMFFGAMVILILAPWLIRELRKNSASR